MVALATTGVPGLDVRRARCKQQPDAAERTLAETCKRFTQRGRLSVPAIPPFARGRMKLRLRRYRRVSATGNRVTSVFVLCGALCC